MWRALTLPWRLPEALMVIDPELLPSAFLATRVRRVPLVVDVHEDYAKVARDRPWARGPIGPMAALFAHVATLIAARAELTSVADEHLPPQRARHRIVVRNLPRRGEIPRSERNEHPRAIYIGDVRPSRGLFTMIDAISLAPAWELDIVGNVSEIPHGDIHKILQERGLSERVRLHGRLVPSEAWAVARGAWCGFALLHDTPAYREAMPTKVYEYLGAGIPVIATALPRVAALLEAAQAGRTGDSAEQVAAILRDWQVSPATVDGLASNARYWSDSTTGSVSPFDELAEAMVTVLPPPQGT